MSRSLKGSKSIVLALSLAVTLCILDTRAQVPSCLVETTLGGVQGIDGGSSCTFLGVPYAAPPTGVLRWKPPQPAAPWTIALPALTAPPNCPALNAASLPGGNEDCLKLNIWVPNPAPGDAGPGDRVAAHGILHCRHPRISRPITASGSPRKPA